jgi:hypothetical protein
MPSINSFGVMSPAAAFAITPSDTVDLPYPVRGIYVGVGGALVVLLADDTVAVNLENAQSGAVYPLQIKRVLDSGTGATDLVGLR